MSQMWHERASYGHFFYRIPNGESAADAYDRISGFNESLWRYFSEDDFASVCILVTHGLMARVFLMKWYHFSVEYFEDLRNVDHCEFIVLKLDEKSGKYRLLNDLRTWSQLRREREEKERELGGKTPESPVPVRKKWAGCLDEGKGRDASSWGQRDGKEDWIEKNGLMGDDFTRRQARRRGTEEVETAAPTSAAPSEGGRAAEKDAANHLDAHPSPLHLAPQSQSLSHANTTNSSAFTTNNATTTTNETSTAPNPSLRPLRKPPPHHLRSTSDYLTAGRDGGGSRSGAASPALLGEFHDSDSSEEGREKERVGMVDGALGVKKQIASRRVSGSALKTALSSVNNDDDVYADVLGDQNANAGCFSRAGGGGGDERDSDEEDRKKFDSVERMRRLEICVDGSVR